MALDKRYENNWSSNLKGGPSPELKRRIEKQHQKEKGLCKLVINSKICLYVPPEKCNEQYANEWRERYLQHMGYGKPDSGTQGKEVV